MQKDMSSLVGRSVDLGAATKGKPRLIWANFPVDDDAVRVRLIPLHLGGTELHQQQPSNSVAMTPL
jgi:hypothetical protein